MLGVHFLPVTLAPKKPASRRLDVPVLMHGYLVRPALQVLCPRLFVVLKDLSMEMQVLQMRNLGGIAMEVKHWRHLTMKVQVEENIRLRRCPCKTN